MRTILGAATFAAAALAAVLPRDQCCFQIYASGGVQGVMGQFEDGQNRINGSYAAATYCYSNGGIIDMDGRGCIVTTDNDQTYQLQCDQGKPPTLGFSIANDGSILFKGSDQFYACPYVNEYNVYTQWLKGQDKCRPIKLNTNGSCSAPGQSIPPSASSSAGFSVSTGEKQSTASYTSLGTPSASTSAVASKSSPVKSSASKPVIPGHGASSAMTSTHTSLFSSQASFSTPGSYSPVAIPGSKSSVETSTPVASSSPIETTPAEKTPIEKTPATDTVLSTQLFTVTCSSCEVKTVVVTKNPPTPSTGIESSSVEIKSATTSAPTESSSDIQNSPKESTSTSSSVPTGTTAIATGQVTPSPAPISSVPEETTVIVLTTLTTSDCETSTMPASTPAASSSAVITPSTPAIPVQTNSATSSVPEEITIVQLTTLTTSDCETTATSPSGPALETPPASSTSSKKVPIVSSSQSASTVFVTPMQPAASSGSSTENSETATSSMAISSVSTTGAVTTSSTISSVPATSTKPAPPASNSSCQPSTTQTPNLIVPIASAYPYAPQGNHTTASVNMDCSSIFNFEIPKSYAGKTCSVVFLFPEQKGNSSTYTFSGSGDLVFSSLNGVVNEETTFNNAPEINGTLDSVCIKPGNDYVVATAPCAAGTTQSIELSSANGLILEFCEENNLGLYITAC